MIRNPIGAKLAGNRERRNQSMYINVLLDVIKN